MARRRSLPRELASLLDSSSRPIYAIDGRRRIVYCNAACAEWLGVEIDKLVGLQCDYRAATPDPADLPASLCPPPEAFFGKSQSGILVHRSAEETGHCSATFIALSDIGAADPIGVLVVVGDCLGEKPEEPELDDIASGDLHHRLQSLYYELRLPYHLDLLVGESAAIRRIRDQVVLGIQGRSRVVVVGAPGSGREHIARTIHSGIDPHSADPLMPLSCSLLDPDLLQTTVMAFLRRCRESESAATATLLLLDVDQLSLDSQLELLAFFQVPTLEIRTLVTTERSLTELAAEDRFQGELSEVLSTLVIDLPPLAERRKDIPYLAQQFLEQFNASGGRQLSGFSTEALDRLCSLPWPGNIEELAEVVGEACDAADGTLVSVDHLPRRVDLLHSAAAHPPPEEDPTIKLDDFMIELERELICRAMRRSKGNKAQAARLLGIHRARLLRRLEQLGVESDS